MDRPDLEIRRLDAAVADATIDCIARVYPRDNVIARALEFTATDYRPHAARVVATTVADDLGLVVVDPEGGAVVGFYFARDLVDHRAGVAALAADDDPRLRAWGEMHRRLLELHDAAHGPPRPRGEVLYLNIMALDAPARGRGLMHTLTIQAILDFGVARGYAAVVGVATHPRSVTYGRSMTAPWSVTLPFAALADPRLAALPGVAEIHRADLDALATQRARDMR